MVGVLHESGVDLHLSRQDRLQLIRHVIPRRYLVWSVCQLGVLWNHAKLFLPGEGPVTQRIPTIVEFPLVLIRPFRRYVMRSVSGPRCVVGEERLVRHQRLLLANPTDGVIGHVLTEVIIRILDILRFDRDCVLIDRRCPLVGLPADEPVEMLETLPGRPLPKRPHRRGLPNRDLMTLPELRSRITVQLQHLSQRRRRVGDNRRVARSAAGKLRYPTHTHRVVVAAGEKSRPRRRTQGGGMEPVVLQTIARQALRRRSFTRAAEGTRRAKPHIVDQNHQNIGCTFWWTNLGDRRKSRSRILGVVGDQTLITLVGYGKHLTLDIVRHSQLLASPTERRNLAASDGQRLLRLLMSYVTDGS